MFSMSSIVSLIYFSCSSTDLFSSRISILSLNSFFTLSLVLGSFNCLRLILLGIFFFFSFFIFCGKLIILVCGKLLYSRFLARHSFFSVRLILCLIFDTEITLVFPTF
uniref:Uncharacterized protein n=1 Tax=Cacopsylla melanoneura TaxID=428564 RepID=A0A8D8YWY3_9HEMI